jgi:hypothetical protein
MALEPFGDSLGVPDVDWNLKLSHTYSWNNPDEYACPKASITAAIRLLSCWNWLNTEEDHFSVATSQPQALNHNLWYNYPNIPLNLPQSLVQSSQISLNLLQPLVQAQFQATRTVKNCFSLSWQSGLFISTSSMIFWKTAYNRCSETMPRQCVGFSRLFNKRGMTVLYSTILSDGSGCGCTMRIKFRSESDVDRRRFANRK